MIHDATLSRREIRYQCEGTQSAFFKVYLALPTLVPTLKRILEGGIVIPGCGGGQQIPCQTFESNVPFLLRFMIDKEISGMNWLTVPARHYTRRPSSTCKSTCQLEFDCVFDSIVSHKAEGEWNRIAPLRVLSVDIECCGRKGHFPEAEQDPVIQISNVVNVQGEKQAFTQNVFTLGGCLPIVGAQVITSTTEHEMLQRWAEFVRVVDPDIITGYNTQNFDVPYLLNRGKALAKVKGRVGPSFDRFFHWGRMRGTPARMRDSTFSSAQYGKRENIETTVDGRVMFDLLPYMFRNHKLSSYSLNSVCAEFLGQQKEDVHHSIIADLQNGSDADRRRLAVYCLKDSQLVGLLLDKLSVLVNYIEMARVTGVPVDFLLSRGQQIKVFSMLLRKCRRENLLIPNIAKHVRGGEEDGVGYEGATVIEPKRAFYQDPIATLDFASLYPSIMQAYNLCYSTLIAGSAVNALVEAGKLGPDDFAVAPTDGKDTFVKATTRKGILPQILDELLAARKRAKKDMKAATDPMEYAVQNGRQLALKVSANSVYGFTGATVGQLPCLPIASSVTAYGRELLLKTKQHVEDNYEGSEVVYGDTDSVMIRFGLSTVEETMPLAEKVADEVSAIFPRPVQLEFEKVYCPFLLMNKKRYAGLLWTNPEKFDKLDAKGLETVRRDNCLLVRQLIDRCLRTMLINKDVEAAIAYAKNSISDLLQNKLDISLLVITKSLSKSADSEEYKSTMPHVELAKKLAKRDPLTAPAVGDRVPYVIIQGAKGASASERAEDPVYVLDNNVPIDTKYYLENQASAHLARAPLAPLCLNSEPTRASFVSDHASPQLKNPLERIFEPIIENCSTLFVGEHTRTICKPTPTARKGGIMSFAVKKSKCLGCKALIDDGDGHLCAHCRPRESEIYLAKVSSSQLPYSEPPGHPAFPLLSPARPRASLRSCTSTRTLSRGCGRNARHARARFIRMSCAPSEQLVCIVTSPMC